MSRVNNKDRELTDFCNMMITAVDYGNKLEKMNGFRMGLTNRYKNRMTSTIQKRLDTWKLLVDLYK